MVLEKTLDSPLDCKEIQPAHPKGVQFSSVQSLSCVWLEISPEYSLGCWSWNSSTLATRCQELTHWKRPWCWERLKAGGEGDDRGQDGWMASQTQGTWSWASSGSWWWTWKPGVLQFMESQRVRHNWAIELNWTDRCCEIDQILLFQSNLLICF